MIVKILFLISFFYLCITVFNDGMSEWYFSIPFLYFLILRLIKKTFKEWGVFEKISLILIVLFIVGINISRESLKIFYPEVGEVLVVKADMEIVNSKFSPNSVIFLTDQAKKKDYEEYKKFYLKKGDKINIYKKIISNFPDFSISYIYQISLSNKEVQKKFLKESKKYLYTNMGYVPDWYSFDKLFLNSDMDLYNDFLEYDIVKFDEKNWFYKYNSFNFIFLLFINYFMIVVAFTFTDWFLNKK